MLIDTHCHLNDAKAFPDPSLEIAAAHEAGVERLIVVGTDPDDWERATGLAERFEEVYAIVGWHPNYTADYDPSTLARLESLLGQEKVLALGEIGLDYHWDYAPRDRQRQALQDQLDLAARRGLPTIFHAREAYGDLLDVLESRGAGRYLFHCWAGTAEEAARGVALGGYFGVDGPITYKNAHALRETIATIPPDRLVVETDAPYMTPVPFRGKPNRPAYVSHVNAGLAAVLNLSPEACADLTTANARAFFGI